MLEMLQTFWTVWEHEGLKIQLFYLLQLIHEHQLREEGDQSSISDIRSITVKYKKPRRGSMTYTDSETAIENFIAHVNSVGREPLEYLDGEHRGFVHDLVATIFRDELSCLDPRWSFPDGPPESLMISYGSLVTQVASFSNESET